MKKGKSISLLAIIGLIMVGLLVLTFITFPVGVKNFNVLGAIEKGHDVDGGYAFTYTLAKGNVEEVDDVNDVLETIEKRVNALGYTSYSIKAIKNASLTDYDIRLELGTQTNKYGNRDYDVVNEDVKAAMEYGKLKFFGGTEANPEAEIFTSIENPVKSVTYGGYSSTTALYLVNIEFSSDAWTELSTAMGVGQYYLKLTLGDEVLSPFDGNSAVSAGNFMNRVLTIQSGTEETARQQVLRMSSGGLDVEYKRVATESGIEVGSPIGAGMFDVATACGIAGVAIIVFAVVALLVANKGYGFVALYTLLAYGLIYVAMLLAVPGITLSLGAIVAMLLATVLTVDGLVIIIKRVNEEFTNGKMLKPAVKTAFNRSLKPILNTAAITVIVSVLLIIFAKTIAFDFGVVLAIGTVISAFSNLLLAKMFTGLFLGASGYKPCFLKLKREESAEV